MVIADYLRIAAGFQALIDIGSMNHIGLHLIGIYGLKLILNLLPLDTIPSSVAKIT